MSDSGSGAMSPRDQGETLIRQGRFAEAATALRRAVEDSPSDEIAWRLLGAALSGSGERDGAVAAFEQAVALAPHSPKSHYNLAIALQGIGETADARGHLERAVALDPNYSQAKIALGALTPDTGVTGPRSPEGEAHPAPAAEPSTVPQLREPPVSSGQAATGVAPAVSFVMPPADAPAYSPPGAYAPPPVLGIHLGPQENTSGLRSTVPPEIDGKWHWGAFSMTWIWMLNHGMALPGFVLLLFYFIVWLCTRSVSILGFLINLIPGIYLADKGNALAWKNRRFSSLEDFQACQKIWTRWGVALMILWAGLLMLNAVLAAIHTIVRRSIGP